MADLSDVALQRESEAAPPPSAPPRDPGHGMLATAVVILVAIVVAAFLWFRPSQSSTVAETPPAGMPSASEVREPLGGMAATMDLPPLDMIDALVRKLASAISTHPMAVAWLATDDLIRSFVVVVSNVADGRTPARQLRVLAPGTSFRASERGEDLVLDPASFARYDALADAAESMDVTAAAKVYGTLKPRIDEAFAELGSPDATFDATLERALVVLLGTPIVEGAISVEPRGIVYAFADANLESAPPAQKQLLRAGPRNVRRFRIALYRAAVALGIPEARLPARIS